MQPPIPNPLPSGWRVVEARTQAECDAVEPCGDRVILVLTPSEAIDVELQSCIGPGTCGDVAIRSDFLAWLIVRGGESPLHPDWVRSLRDQAEEAGVPFWFEGWGEWYPACQWRLTPVKLATANPNLASEWLRDPHTGSPSYYRVGPSRSGRLLDGREWSQVPEELQR